MASTPKYLRPYQFAEQIHGPTFSTTLWNSRASQRIRFQILAETRRLAEAGNADAETLGRGNAGTNANSRTRGRLLDAGCGLGDFLAYLEEIGEPPSHYVGIDALPSIIAEAARRPFATRSEFHAGDIVASPELLASGSPDPPDEIVISGTLNTLPEAAFFATLDRAFAATRRCLLFNFLSTGHGALPAGDGTIVRMDPAQVLAHGLARTQKIIVRHDYYDGRDCTMAWIKEAV